MSMRSDMKNISSLRRNLILSAVSNLASYAIKVNNERVTYSSFFSAALHISFVIKKLLKKCDNEKIIGIIVDRDLPTYLGFLGIILSEYTYVPINVKFPAARSALMLNRSNCQLVLAGYENEKYLDQVISHYQGNIKKLILPSSISKYPRNFIGGSTFDECANNQYYLKSTVYILFTSGSTGEPKAVPISGENLLSYLQSAQSFLPSIHNAKFSQTFDLTFDLSLHDMLLCWLNGGELCVASRDDFFNIVDYINKNEITHWFSVPSAVLPSLKLNRGTSITLPSLRSSLFCGEALSWSVAKEWQVMAPFSIIENWYGPTEATIACFRYPINQDLLLHESLNPKNLWVPIGKAFPCMSYQINYDGQDSTFDSGELVLYGRQISKGYLNPGEIKVDPFFYDDHQSLQGYRTGDRVTQANDALEFIGRLDSQIKLRGYRIELSEIEASISKYDSNLVAVAITEPFNSPTPKKIILCCQNQSNIDVDGMHEFFRANLPEYMIPAEIVVIDEMPRNASGKLDRANAYKKVSLRKAELNEVSIEDSLENELYTLLRSVNPVINLVKIKRARSLISAGLDSLEIIEFITLIEGKFFTKFDEHEIALIAEGYWDDIVKHLKININQPQSGDRKVNLKIVNPIIPSIPMRAARTFDFLFNFKREIGNIITPICIFIGSSGVYRSIDTMQFESLWFENYGEQISAYNLGLPAIDAHSISLICNYLKLALKEKAKKKIYIVYELDPMLLSEIPPKENIRLSADQITHFSEVELKLDLGNEFRWLVEHKGNIPGVLAAVCPKKTGWLIEREKEIVDTYLGGVPFDSPSVESWISGLKSLQDLTDMVAVFVHPYDLRISGNGKIGGLYHALINELRCLDGLTLIDWDFFDIANYQFRDVNHLSGDQSRFQFTNQLFKIFFSSR